MSMGFSNGLSAVEADIAALQADVTALQADVTAMQGDVTNIDGDTSKIDGAATDGLLGTANSTAYRVHEIEKHLHGWESWFGLASTPTATHKADRIGQGGGNDAPFVIDAGNDTWGTWVQILGSADTPARASMAKYDAHRIEVTNAERNSTYFFQFAEGATGAAALTAGTYSGAVFQPQSNQLDAGPVDIMMGRADASELLWARCMCPGQDTGTLSFYFGLHEYAG